VIDLPTIIIQFFITVAAAVLSFAFGRRRAEAESGKLDSESGKIESESESLIATTIKTFQGIYQDLIRDQMVRITRLETEQTSSEGRIVGLELVVAEQRELITSLRAEIHGLKQQLVDLGHVPRAIVEGDRDES
jgi:uncharacterized coiled-coil protein SlyX